MTLEEQIERLKNELRYERELRMTIEIAYRNCVNDHNRAKSEMKVIEDTLFNLSENLKATAISIGGTRIDNPGVSGSGKL